MKRAIYRYREASQLFAAHSSKLLWTIDRVLARLTARGLTVPRLPQIPVWLKNLSHPVWIRPGTTDLLVLEELYLGDEYEDLIVMLRGSEQLIVDLGANIGLSVCLWARCCPTAQIIAVEPDDANAALCEKNSRSASNRVTVVRALIGAHDGWGALDRSAGEWAYRKATDCRSRSEVPILSMGTLISRYIGAHAEIDLVKIDIEGAEVEIFSDPSSWLPRCRLAAVELHDNYYDVARLRADLEKAGLSASYEVNILANKGSTILAVVAKK